jgi:predicted RNA-binding Zn-ribbon protein involved in translation (DUF1610 family)
MWPFRKKETYYIHCDKCGFDYTLDHAPESDLHAIMVNGKASKDRCPNCGNCGGFVDSHPWGSK